MTDKPMDLRAMAEKMRESLRKACSPDAHPTYRTARVNCGPCGLDTV